MRYESPQIELRTAVSAPLNQIAGPSQVATSPKWRTAATGPAYDAPGIEARVAVSEPLNTVTQPSVSNVSPKWDTTSADES